MLTSLRQFIRGSLDFGDYRVTKVRLPNPGRVGRCELQPAQSRSHALRRLTSCLVTKGELTVTGRTGRFTEDQRYHAGDFLKVNPVQRYTIAWRQLTDLILVEELADDGSLQSADGGSLYSQAMTLLKSTYANPRLSGSSLALTLAVSERHLQRAFAEHGTTLSESLQEYRVKRAERLFSHPQFRNASLEAIAQCVGFENALTMRRAFQTARGKSPRDIRNSIT